MTDPNTRRSLSSSPSAAEPSSLHCSLPVNLGAQFRRRLQAAILSPLVVVGISSMGCLEDENVTTRKFCVTPTVAESCPTKDNIERRRSLTSCSEKLISVDSEAALTASGSCCFDITVEVGLECPSNDGVVDGRPLRLQKQVVLAESIHNSQWHLNSMQLDIHELNSAEQRGLAERWTKAGLYEHASVASFQRHALELMKWGAPASLVRQATQAALDEIEHASLCFALASAYASTSIGPGRLPIGADIEIAESLQQLALDVFEDGCINETMAALEAELCQQTAEAPEVQSVLATLARDESNHAELAWRTLSWICSQLGPEALAPLQVSLAAQIRRASTGVTEEQNYLPSAAERQHGRLSGLQRNQLFQQTLQSVIAPCLEQLELALKTPASSASFWGRASA